MSRTKMGLLRITEIIVFSIFLATCSAEMLTLGELQAYVAQLPLDSSLPAGLVMGHSQGRNRRDTEAEEDIEMIGGTLAIFAPDVTEENRRAAENCMLFAELAAKQQVSRDDSFSWFEAYYNVLTNLGWYTVSSAHDNQRSSSRKTSFGREFLEILTSLISRRIIPTADGQTLISDLRRMMNALENTNETSFWAQVYSDAHRSFARNAFNVALVSQSANRNLPIITFNAFEVNVQLSSWTVLWAKYKKESFEIKSERKRMVLNEGIYERIRDTLEERLFEQTSAFISEITFE